jgi:hypothetical protein
VTVVCGFVKVEDLGAAATDVGTRVGFLLLDASPEEIRARLTGRYAVDGVLDPALTVIGKPVETFIAGNVWVAGKLREACVAAGGTVVDTTGRERAAVAQDVAEAVLQAAGSHA